MAVQNMYKVPKKQWTKWNKKEVRLMFNGLYGSMIADPDLFQDAKAIQLEVRFWKPVAWNTAWIAAEMLDSILYPED